MFEINELNHVPVVISSLDKIYNKAKVNGKLNSINLYIFNIIFKLLNSEILTLTDVQIQKLKTFYSNIYFNSQDICKTKGFSPYILPVKNKFFQAETTDCNIYPKFENIYYWQEEELLTRYVDIYPLSKSDDFVKNKLFDTEAVFETGKFISYLNIGVIGFFITDTKSNDVYKIYDYLDNDVTDLFDQGFINERTSTLFVSKNIYSHGIMKFKIKKIITTQEDIFTDIFNDTFN